MSSSEVRYLAAAVGKSSWPKGDRPEIAFAGRSNVGKSSCLNALLGRHGIARVSKTPGRTQALQFFDLRRRGHEIRFVDLPGYGFAKVSKSMRAQWDRMIGEYLAERENLRLVVVLADLRHEGSPLDKQMVDWLERCERTGLLVATKSDQVRKSRRVAQLARLCRDLEVPREAALIFSSLDGTGREELWRRIEEALEPPPEDGAAEAPAGPGSPGDPSP
jgi:GTP-binding protein